MKRTLLCLALAGGCFAGHAQVSMVEDFNATGSSSPTWLTVFKDKLVFMADDGTNGNELCMLDTGGVSLVFNINPGGAAAAGFINSRTMAMTDSGTLYFPADNGTSGSELYMWDGKNMPLLAYDVNAGGAGSGITELVAIGRKVYFAYNDVTNGSELWSYDEVGKSIQRLTNINPGAGSSNPHNLTVYKGKLYFAATNPTAITGTGIELYMHNPATNATSLVSDINPGTVDGDPASMVVVGGKMYFSATVAGYGRELFSLDSTNVIRATDVYALNGNGMPASATAVKRIVAMDSNIYFAGDDGTTGTQLYKLNTKTNSTSLVYSINPVGNSNPGNFVTYGKNMYFVANDGTHGNELWMYDGKTTPMMVADLNAGTNNSDPNNLVVYKNVLYFTATDLTTGTELYMLKDSSTGIQNVRFDADVKTYPNPATAAVNFDMNLKNSEVLSIRMIDMSGREVYNSGVQHLGAGKNVITVPMNNMAPGVYIYQVVNAKGTNYLAGRIVKE